MNRSNVGSAVVAGVLGTLAMTVLMYTAPLMGLPPMDLLGALGGVLPTGLPPYLVGGVIHLGIGVVLALVYALVFERVLPGPRWARGAIYSLLPWLFAITLMGPAMAWVQEVVGRAEARSVGQRGAISARTINPCGALNPCAAVNPCAARNPCAAVNPCAAGNPVAGAPAPWLLRLMSLVVHAVYGVVVATVYRRSSAARE